MKKERTFVIDGEKITAEVERMRNLRITVGGETHTVKIAEISALPRLYAAGEEVPGLRMASEASSLRYRE